MQPSRRPPTGNGDVLHRGCACLHRGCAYLHRGCACLHRGCTCLHRGCACLHRGCAGLHWRQAWSSSRSSSRGQARPRWHPQVCHLAGPDPGRAKCHSPRSCQAGVRFGRAGARAGRWSRALRMPRHTQASGGQLEGSGTHASGARHLRQQHSTGCVSWRYWAGRMPELAGSSSAGAAAQRGRGPRSPYQSSWAGRQRWAWGLGRAAAPP